MNRFIVLSSGLTPSQKNEITAFLKTSPYGWAKYLNDSWFVSTRADNVTAKILAEQLREVASGGRLIVVKTEGKISWWGWSDKRMWQWLRKNFSNPPSDD